MSRTERLATNGLTRFDLVVAVGLLLMAGFMFCRTRQLPGVVGWFNDDGVYLATAKALAEGRGYRHLELPGEPFQTKYPILYPLVLAAIWRLWPDFPANIPAFQALNVALWTLGSWIVYRLMCRTWKVPWWLPAIGVILAFANYVTVELLRTTMSEPLYLVLAAAALALACAADPAEATYNGRRLMALALASGVLAAAAYLARTIGLSLLAAVPLAWAMNRRWKCAALAAVAPVLALVGWRAWYLYATGFNMANPVYKAIGYDLNYNAWIPALGTVGRVVYHNVADLALALFDLLLPWWPEDDKKQMLAQGLSGAWPLYLGMVASIGLAVVGLAATWKRARPAIHFYLLFYTVLVLAWPFRTLRFIIPILPLVITLQLVGLYVLGLWLFDRVTGRTKQSLTDRWSASRPGANFALRFVVVPVLVLGYVHFLPLAGFGKKINPRPGVWQSEREPLVDLICAQTPRDAVISSNSGGYFYLRTGRKFVPPLPNTDLLDVLYPDDRTFLQCGQVVTPGMFAADLRYTRTQLEPYIRAAGITFLVPMELRGNSYWAVLNELKEREPGRFRLVGQTPIYELYQVSPPRR